jgi:hypothetical protein
VLRTWRGKEMNPYYPLFEYFHDQHGLILVDSEIQDIIREVKEWLKSEIVDVPADIAKIIDKEFDNLL